MNNKSLRNVLLVGAVWDIIGGIIFLVFHGILHKQLIPVIYPFYSMVIGIFLLMLAYIQLISAADTQRYGSNIGVVIILRVFYATTVVLYSVLSEILPMQFIAIAVVDSIFVVLLIFFATKRGKFSVGELFFPLKDNN